MENDENTQAMVIVPPIDPKSPISVYVSPIVYNLDYYKEKKFGDIEIPPIATPLISLLPNGKTSVGSSQQTSVVTIEVKRDVWDENHFVATLNSAKIDLCSLEQYLVCHETLSVSCNRHEIPSKCNVYPFFSATLPSFGSLVNICMQNIFILKSFMDAISTIPLQNVMISGCIVEKCKLTLTRNIRSVQLDCAKDGVGLMEIFVPYGCRLELLELYCHWAKSVMYTQLSKIYVLEFEPLPTESISKPTLVEKIVLDIMPDDFLQLPSLMCFFRNILCTKIIFLTKLNAVHYTRASHIDSFYNTRYLKSTMKPDEFLKQFAPAAQDATRKNAWMNVFNILRQMNVIYVCFDALTSIYLFQSMMIEIHDIGVPIIFVEYAYATPRYVQCDPKLYMYLFLNERCVNRKYMHYKTESTQGGDCCPLIDIPMEFTLLNKCQVYIRLTNGCGFLAHKPVMASALRDVKLRDPNVGWYYKVTSYFIVE